MLLTQNKTMCVISTSDHITSKVDTLHKYWFRNFMKWLERAGIRKRGGFIWFHLVEGRVCVKEWVVGFFNHPRLIFLFHFSLLRNKTNKKKPLNCLFSSSFLIFSAGSRWIFYLMVAINIYSWDIGERVFVFFFFSSQGEGSKKYINIAGEGKIYSSLTP